MTTTKTKRRLYLQLGRAGDILNVLPLCLRDWNETGEKPWLMVAADFANLLDGVTYVERVLWNGAFEDVAGAFAKAEELAGALDMALVCTQIYGNQFATAETCSSFTRQSWAQVPGSPPWGSLPLEFDRRDIPRERGVMNNLLQRGTGKPYIVLALSGTSSPFPHGPDLNRYLRNKLGKEFDFVDVSGFVAPRFYDLLTLLEHAHALVTVDSGLLHLAHAVPSLPVVALITREPSLWHGSAWRPQHVARFFYDEAPECFQRLAGRLLLRWEGMPTILHVFSNPPDATGRRIAFAQETWRAEYGQADWRPQAVPADGRTSAEWGDDRPVPYVRDVIGHAERRAGRPEDIIAFTNADVCFTPGLTGWILDKVPRHGAAFTHRYDFDGPLLVPHRNEEETKRGTRYPGSDAFFFTAAWWRKHGPEYPDMLLGREHCDEVLRQLVKRHGGIEIDGAIYHERHPSFWREEALGANPGNQHNRRLARRWFVRTGYGPNDPDWWNIPARPY